MIKTKFIIVILGLVSFSCEHQIPKVIYPHSGKNIILFSRVTYDDYIIATYSFEYATRDDQELASNDWDIEYGNGINDPITVDMVSDDQSYIADLGQVNFDSIKTIPQNINFQKSAMAFTGHVYIVHTNDSESQLYSKFIITDMKHDDWIKLSWVRSDDDVTFKEQ